jgi:hypothetical protein
MPSVNCKHIQQQNNTNLCGVYACLMPFVTVYYTGVPGGEVNILGGLNIGQSKQKSVHVHVSYSERFPK